MKFSPFFRGQSGGTLILVMILMAVLTLVAASTLRSVTNRQTSAWRSASWHNALNGAESAAELALGNLRQSLSNTGSWQTSGNALTAPTSIWGTGWARTTDASGFITQTYSPNSPLLTFDGEGSRRLRTEIQVDSPASLCEPNGRRWYRIRARGISDLPGLRRVSNDKRDNALRTMNLVTGRDGSILTTPETSRLVEVVAKPVGMFDYALLTVENPSLPGSAGVIDSYDSRNAAKSTGGLYDPAKRQQNGDIATLGTDMSLGGMVYGSVATNGGNMQPSSQITGEVRNDFWTEIPPVTKPTTWTSIVATPTTVTAKQTITSGSDEANPRRFKFAEISEELVVNAPAGGGNGYVEIWVTGDIAGNKAAITLKPNVFAKIWFEGNIQVKTRNLDTQSDRAANFILYGIQPPAGVERTVDLMPPSEFIGVIYAPHHFLNLNGNSAIWGSVVAKSTRFNGNTSIHYDEALRADSRLFTRFQTVSWLEDVN